MKVSLLYCHSIVYFISELNLSLEAQLLLFKQADIKLFWQIKPLMKVTHDIMHITSIHYEWHEFFPSGRISLLYFKAVNQPQYA